MASLLMTGENRWNEDLIYNMFEERDVNLILSTPVNQRENDIWYWKKEKMRHYSVKTACVLVQEMKNTHNAGVDSKCWKKLWALKVPPKVKHLMWRAATGCLPSKTQLHQKHVNVNVFCPLCNQDPETIDHVLLKCSFASECWSYMRGSSSSGDYGSFSDWFASEYSSWDTDSRRSGAMLCWSIWKCMNDLIWNQRSLEVVEVVASSKVALNQWQSAQDKTFDSFLGHMTSADGDEQWTVPADNKIKVNCDAAIFEAQNCYSYAFAARDHRGEVVTARSKCSMGNIAPENAEAIGVREALSWIKEEQIRDVLVETDCLVVVQAIRSSGVPLSYFGRIVGECRTLLSELKGRNVMVRFVKRSANKVAHFLAKSTYSIADRIWRVCDNHPGFIDVLMDDLIHE